MDAAIDNVTGLRNAQTLRIIASAIGAVALDCPRSSGMDNFFIQPICADGTRIGREHRHFRMNAGTS